MGCTGSMSLLLSRTRMFIEGFSILRCSYWLTTKFLTHKGSGAFQPNGD